MMGRTTWEHTRMASCTSSILAPLVDSRTVAHGEYFHLLVLLDTETLRSHRTS